MSAAGLALAVAALAAPVDVLDFQVEVRPDFAARSISGQTRVRFASRVDGLTEVSFSANALTIEAATASGRPIQVERRGEALVAKLPAPLAKGAKAEVTLRYSGRPARGLVFGPAYAYAGYFACDWMICSQDAPGDKARLTLALTAPAGAVTQGPGRLVSRQAAGEGMERQVWRETRPYSSYLFGFAVGDFQRAGQRHGRADLIFLSPTASPERLGQLFAPTGEMIDFFEAKAGLRLPHDRYVQLHVPGSDAQEAANYSILGEAVLAPRLMTPQEDWAIAHELAHQWWGNLVTCRDWSQFWLNEGVTVFMTAAWKEHRWGRAAYDREMDLARRRVETARAAGVDVPLTFAGPYPSLATRRAIAYSKGALFMDRLRTEMGDEAFWRALKAYTRAHAGGVVDSGDFQRAFQAATPRDLAPLFAEWVYGA